MPEGPHSEVSERRRLTNMWGNWPIVDYVITVIVVGGTVVAAGHGHDFVGRLDRSARHDWCGIMAAVTGAILSFGAATTAIVFAFAPAERMRLLMATVGRRLNTLFISCLAMLAIATLGLAAAIPFDTADRASGVRFVVVGLVTIAALRVGRLLWLFSKLLAVAAADALDEARVGVTPIDKTWTPPIIARGDYAMKTRRTAPKRARNP